VIMLYYEIQNLRDNVVKFFGNQCKKDRGTIPLPQVF